MFYYFISLREIYYKISLNEHLYCFLVFYLWKKLQGNNDMLMFHENFPFDAVKTELQYDKQNKTVAVVHWV